MNSQDPFSQWGNSPTDSAATFGLDVASPHPSSQGLQQRGAASYSYSGGTAPISTGPSTARTTSSQFPGPSASAPRDSRRGRQDAVPQAPSVPPPLNTLGLDLPDSGWQDRNRLSAGWPGSPPTGDTSANAIPRRSSRSGSHSQQQRVEYSPTQTTFGNGNQRRPSPQRYDPPAPPLEDTQMSVDPISGSQRKCIIPDCHYPAYYNVAEEELMEYCGHGHELQAIETGFVKPCAMCKARPRRTNERVCGPVCRERERNAHIVQGSYYGVQVTRREPRTR